MKTKNLIIICLTIIIILCIGLTTIFYINIIPHETNIKILTKQNLTQGDVLKLKLTDNNGDNIANQIIELSISYKNGSSYHKTKIKTNENGEAEITNIKPGNYVSHIIYSGNNEYQGTNITYKFKVKYKKTKKTINTNEYATSYKVDEVINGWDPSEHEVSREDLGDGNQRVNYDDGYSRIIDKDGNILSYGY